MDNDSNNMDKDRDGFLFQHLVVMFQTLALQQMGKLTSPITGKVERDLHQAKITIDMLDMIQNRTEGNLEDIEKRLLDTVIMELQMNYVDETARAGGEDEDSEVAEKEEEKDIEEDSGGTEDKV